MNYQPLLMQIRTNWRAYKWHYARSVYHELLWAMTQSQLIAINNSDVNPPQNLLDGGSLPSRESSTTDPRTAASSVIAPWPTAAPKKCS